MSKIKTLILAAMTLALAGCCTFDTRTSHSHRSAIESVFTQHATIEQEHAGVLSGERVAGLMAIDVRGCPADFRSTWFDYLVEVRALHTRVERVAGIASGVGKPVSDLQSLIKFAATTPEVGQYLLAALEKVDDAWAMVERAGMTHGVVPKFEVNRVSHHSETTLEPAPAQP
jgi:hypothetical protein